MSKVSRCQGVMYKTYLHHLRYVQGLPAPALPPLLYQSRIQDTLLKSPKEDATTKPTDLAALYLCAREQARENLAALKELRIRGDFRTIVEHLVMIREKGEFQVNTYNTGWLNTLMEAKEMGEKPNIEVTLVCGALNIQTNFQNFKISQVPLKELSTRGNFRTIMEHLVMILEKKFQVNTYDTGGLDMD